MSKPVKGFLVVLSALMLVAIPDSLGQGKAKHIEMVIRDIADVKERILRWEL